MRVLEANSEYLGVSTLQLMENAGAAVAAEVAARFHPSSSIAVFCGTGRNGGDGMVAARHLAALGYNAQLIMVGGEDQIKEPIVIQNWMSVKNMASSLGTKICRDSTSVQPVEADVIIDAVLGIGARGQLREPVLEAVRAINKSRSYKLALDVPTGIDADSGEVLGEAVQANLTVTFHASKTGFKKAAQYLGELKVVDIGIPPEAAVYCGPGDVKRIFKPRAPESHKGDFGRLLIVAGSRLYTGAPAHVAMAALRAGVDQIFVAAPEKTAEIISTFSPDMVTIKLRGEHLAPEHLPEIKKFAERCSAIAVGPGLGLEEETFKAVSEITSWLCANPKPAVYDADALKAFGSIKPRIVFPLVLTPHAGEFRAIAGKEPSSSPKERLEDVKQLAEKTGSTVLLKGRIDIISDGHRVKQNFTGNPYMTTGGTGDVLTGITGCFLAQGGAPFEAAAAAAFLNGLAGDLVVKNRGPPLTATDVVAAIPDAFKAVDSGLRARP